MESINFRKIFKDSAVSVASPFNSNNLSAPTISYHYSFITIRSRVLNYKEAYDDYSEPNTMSCDCSSSTFMDNHIHSSMLKDRESTRQLLTYLLGGLIEVDDLKVTRPPFWNRKGKQTIIFISGKEDAIQALRKEKSSEGGPFIAH